ncbi:MAG: cytochrome c oxidase subunit 4 [Candidatus Limnocylindrales bacterium]
MIEELWSSLIGFTSQFVIPDWGSLIALLPIFLAIPVLLYLTSLIYRFATAGPTRRGKRRLPPAAPAGIHMPGPSFAPVLGAIGLFFMVFGMVAGGLWLAVGAVILAITLLYWGREALREYDTLPSGDGSAVTVGMLPAPAGSPPAGVHMPPPSFRPILVAIALTMLVAGMVIGGWGLFLGFIAIVITLVGWLWDARKEYRAVEVADTTGHLDLGGAPAWPRATFAALVVLVAFTLLFTSGVLPNGGNGEAAVPSGAPGGGGSPPSVAPSLPAADVTITAKDIAWTTPDVTAPAGKPFTIALDNRDSVPHNIVIKDAGGSAVFSGDLVTGPKVVIYNVPALGAGAYTFSCIVHPNMTGTVAAK